MAFRNVCFTTFEIERDLFADVPSYVVYCVYQVEMATETLRPHYQGYAEFNNGIKMPRIKAWLGDTVHLERRKGTRDQARAYCMKDPSDEGGRMDGEESSGPFEYGTYAELSQGQRTDIDECVECALQHGLKEAFATFPGTMAKYHKGVAAVVNANKPRVTDAEFEPRPWQKKLLHHVANTDSDREIIWVHESRGNVGKSRLAHNLCCEHNAVELHGKVADMAFGYNDEPIVIFDLARTSEDCYKHLYNFAEKLKNGRFFSPKYESGMKIFKPPTVLFFANFAPPTDAWSLDRVREFDLNCPDHHV